MTCIVGVKTNNGVYIGADSAATNDAGLQTIIASGKVFFVGDSQTRMLIGCTTSCRMMQLIHYELQLPAYESDMDIERYLVTRFIPALRSCLKDGGFAKKENEQETGGNFLVGFRGRLFEVQEDYQVSEPTSGYESVGSGSLFALGALFASKDMSPRQRIEQALQAAAYHNAYVRPPYFIEFLGSEQHEENRYA